MSSLQAYLRRSAAIVRCIAKPARELVRRFLALPALCLIYGCSSRKTACELRFWRKWFRAGGQPGCRGEGLSDIIRSRFADLQAVKTILDFGCGPVCALESLSHGRVVYGVDVLAGHYQRLITTFGHKTSYQFISCDEQSIPLPDGQVDLAVTANALDHCRHPEAMLAEIARTLRPDGRFLGLFNIGGSPTLAEPSPASAPQLEALIQRYFQVLEVRRFQRGPPGDFYQQVISNEVGWKGQDNGEEILLIRATVKSN